jgi:hypothetical protein
VQRLNKVKQSILPNYLFIPEAPSITFDSFTGLQRMITVQLSFTLVVPTNCEPIVSKLVECLANIVTSSNLTAALKNLIDLTSTLQASSSLSANLQLTKFAASSLNANASLNASALVSKLAASSLTGAGTLAADLTVTGGSAFDADAQAFFDRVTTAGGTLTATEQNAVNTLVVGMKADGIWDKMKAIYPMVGASAASCVQNLKSASFTGTLYGANTFSSNGLITNGTNAAMGTNLRPSTSLTLYSNHISIYNKSEGGKNYVFSNYSDGPAAALSIQSLTPYLGRNTSQTLVTVTVPNSLGFYLNRRLSNIEMSLFKNSIKLITNTSNAGTIQPPGGLVIGATSYNNGLTPNFGYSSIICSFASVGDGLDDTEAVNFYTRVQAFQTTLNRQEI